MGNSDMVSQNEALLAHLPTWANPASGVDKKVKYTFVADFCTPSLDPKTINSYNPPVTNNQRPLIIPVRRSQRLQTQPLIKEVSVFETGRSAQVELPNEVIPQLSTPVRRSPRLQTQTPTEEVTIFGAERSAQAVSPNQVITQLLSPVRRSPRLQTQSLTKEVAAYEADRSQVEIQDREVIQLTTPVRRSPRLQTQTPNKEVTIFEADRSAPLKMRNQVVTQPSVLVRRSPRLQTQTPTEEVIVLETSSQATNKDGRISGRANTILEEESFSSQLEKQNQIITQPEIPVRRSPRLLTQTPTKEVTVFETERSAQFEMRNQVVTQPEIPVRRSEPLQKQTSMGEVVVLETSSQATNQDEKISEADDTILEEETFSSLLEGQNQAITQPAVPVRKHQPFREQTPIDEVIVLETSSQATIQDDRVYEADDLKSMGKSSIKAIVVFKSSPHLELRHLFLIYVGEEIYQQKPMRPRSRSAISQNPLPVRISDPIKKRKQLMLNHVIDVIKKRKFDVALSKTEPKTVIQNAGNGNQNSETVLQNSDETGSQDSETGNPNSKTGSPNSERGNRNSKNRNRSSETEFSNADTGTESSETQRAKNVNQNSKVGSPKPILVEVDGPESIQVERFEAPPLLEIAVNVEYATVEDSFQNRGSVPPQLSPYHYQSETSTITDDIDTVKATTDLNLIETPQEPPFKATESQVPPRIFKPSSRLMSLMKARQIQSQTMPKTLFSIPDHRSKPSQRLAKSQLWTSCHNRIIWQEFEKKAMETEEPIEKINWKKWLEELTLLNKEMRFDMKILKEKLKKLLDEYAKNPSNYLNTKRRYTRSTNLKSAEKTVESEGISSSTQFSEPLTNFRSSKNPIRIEEECRIEQPKKVCQKRQRRSRIQKDVSEETVVVCSTNNSGNEWNQQIDNLEGNTSEPENSKRSEETARNEVIKRRGRPLKSNRACTEVSYPLKKNRKAKTPRARRPKASCSQVLRKSIQESAGPSIRVPKLRSRPHIVNKAVTRSAMRHQKVKHVELKPNSRSSKRTRVAKAKETVEEVRSANETISITPEVFEIPESETPSHPKPNREPLIIKLNLARARMDQFQNEIIPEPSLTLSEINEEDPSSEVDLNKNKNSESSTIDDQVRMSPEKPENREIESPENVETSDSWTTSESHILWAEFVKEVDKTQKPMKMGRWISKMAGKMNQDEELIVKQFRKEFNEFLMNPVESSHKKIQYCFVSKLKVSPLLLEQFREHGVLEESRRRIQSFTPFGSAEPLYERTKRLRLNDDIETSPTRAVSPQVIEEPIVPGFQEEEILVPEAIRIEEVYETGEESKPIIKNEDECFEESAPVLPQPTTSVYTFLYLFRNIFVESESRKTEEYMRRIDYLMEKNINELQFQFIDDQTVFHQLKLVYDLACNQSIDPDPDLFIIDDTETLSRFLRNLHYVVKQLKMFSPQLAELEIEIMAKMISLSGQETFSADQVPLLIGLVFGAHMKMN